MVTGALLCSRINRSAPPSLISMLRRSCRCFGAFKFSSSPRSARWESETDQFLFNWDEDARQTGANTGVG